MYILFAFLFNKVKAPFKDNAKLRLLIFYKGSILALLNKISSKLKFYRLCNTNETDWLNIIFTQKYAFTMI